MKPQDSDDPHHLEDELNGAINRILFTLGLFGLFASASTFIRDLNADYPPLNTGFNLLMVFVVFTLFYNRHRLTYRTKTWWAVLVLYAVGIKSVFIFGTVTGSWSLLLLSATVMFAMDTLRTGFRYCVAMMATYIPLAILCNQGIIPFKIYPPLDLQAPYQWLSSSAGIIFYLAVIHISVGRLHRAFLRLFDNLSAKNHALAVSNWDLESQIARNEKIKQALKDSEERLTTVFDSNLDGMLLTTIEGKIHEVNPALTKLMGITREHALGRHTKEFVVEEDWGKIEDRKVYALNGEPIPIQEVRLFTKYHGLLTMELNSAYLYLRDETLILTTTRDVTERNLAEQAKMRAMIMAEEQERSRLAKDLHDDLGPILSTLKMYIQSLRNVASPEEKEELIGTILHRVDDSIKSVREISYNLSPHLLENMGLLKALETFLQRLRERNHLQAEFCHNFDENCRVSGELERLLYRVALELVNNTLKHANATSIKLTLTRDGNDVRLLYKDNGQGFDISEVLTDHQGGIGVKNIISRVKSVQGWVNFRREAQGMKISVYIPQTKELNLWEQSV